MAAPVRVCDLAGAWHAVDLAPDASEAGAREAIAAVVRLALGTFGLINDRGDGASIRGGLAGDWRVVRLQGQPGAGAAAGGADRDGLAAAIAQMGIKIDEGFSRMGSAIASLKAPSPPPRASEADAEEEEAWDLEHGSLRELSDDAEGYVGRKLAAAVLRDQPIAPGGASPTKA